MRAGVAIVGAALAGLLSVLAAVLALAWQLDETRLFRTVATAQTAPLPRGIPLPKGINQPSQTPLTAGQRERLSRAMWRDPLFSRSMNLIYADAIRRDQTPAEVRRLGALLARLGWRHTAAQRNLVLRALVDSRFGDAVDRVDALLRRQKLAALSYGVLATMEAVPQVHDAVLRKLVARPRWRRDYLSVINAQSGAALLDARVRTMTALLGTPAGLSREELAPSLIALVGSGRGRAAFALWTKRFGGEGDGNLVYDPRFQQATATAGGADLDIPFEWKLTQSPEYSVQASVDGAMISWNRRGVPTFLFQTVPVRPGRSYRLVLRGSADSGTLQSLLSPTLVCGQTSIRFEEAGDTRPGEARYRSPALPKECELGTLAVDGALDTGRGGVNIVLSHVALRASD